MKKIITLCFLMALVCVKGWGQTTVTFPYSSSTQAFTVPTGVSSIKVYVYGAGGGSGGCVTGSSDQAAGGGGGGACAINTLTVSSGQVYTITTGAGGTAGTIAGTAGGTGGSSTITGIGGTVTANGGAGGGGAASNGAAGAAGSGATTGSGYSAIFAGGNGTPGYRNTSNEVGGAGGGGAGNNGAGGAGSGAVGSNTTGGVGGTGTPTNAAPYKGASGSGATVTAGTSAGVAGTAPGGGAAGSASYNATAAGAIGGAGQVVIVYTSPTYIDTWVSMSTGSTTWCAGETRTISVTVKNNGTASWTSGSTGVNFSYWWSNQNRDFNNRLLPFAGLAPGQQQTITFPVTAPSAGTYTLNFDLVKEASCWFADNVSGCSGPGNIVYPSASQTIGALPTVATAAATSVTINSATVPGTITAGCTVITGYGIEYSTTNNFANGTGTAVAGSNLLGSNYTVNLTGLSQGTTYYYHAFVNYSSGNSYSAQGSFITLTPTLSASALAAFGNVCTGTTAGPNSFTITGTNLTAVNIAVGPLTGYTFSTTSTGTYSASLSLTHAAGSYSQAIYVKFTPVATVSYNGNIPISGGGATTINVAASGAGVNSPPIATSGSASSIASNSATVAGSLAAGCSATTAYGIEYSTSASALGVNGGTTATKVAGGTLTSGNFTSALGSLTSNTTYYYDAYATSSGGTTYGSQGSFTTLCGTVASFPFTETFETSSATSNCWSNVYVSGTQNWGYIYGSYSGNVSAPHTGSYDASFNDEFYTTAVTKLVSPVLNLTALSATGARVRFWYQNPYTFDFFDDYHDQLKVYYRTTSTGAWTLIPNAVYKDDIGSWTQVSLILPSISSTYQIAFEGSVDPDFSGYVQSGDLAIDDITIEATPPPPANDDCTGAVALTVNPTCSATPGTTVNATLSQGPSTCSGNSDDDIWYKFIASNTTASVAVSSVASTLDPVIQAFSGNCGTLSSIKCIDANGSGSGETLSLSGLTVGATYYVRVYGYGSDISTQGTFNICVTGTCLAPTAYSVTGGGAYCSGGTGVAVGLSNSQIGFSYQLRNGGTNTGSPVTGTGSAISFGNQTAAGTYTVVATNNGSSGCSTTMTGSTTVSINPNVVAGTVSGTTPLCINGTTTYTSNGTTGGTWTSTATGVATVNASTGAVTAVGAGTTNITYTISSGCGSPVSASKTLTVSPNATAGTVSGTTPLCIGSTTNYTISGNSSPGTWSSTATAVATVNASTGAVTAVGAGTTNITYTVSTGCNAPVSASKTLTVSPNANAGTVSGTSPLCIGTTATYTSSGDAGGLWTSTNTAVATVSSTGVVTAAGAGTSDITYTVSSGCNNPVSAFKTVTVSPNATAGTITGTSPLCIGVTSTYASSGNTSGTWSSNNMSVATVNASTGAVTTVSAGTATITYTVSTGCNNPVSASKILTVSPNANAGTISGATPLCISATSVTYTSNGDAGGSWTSSNTSVATVNATSGAVTAVSAGTATITYTVSTGCNNPVNASKTLTVNPNATAGTVSGTTPLCINATATYTSNGDVGGVWSSTNTNVATVNASTGVVTAVATGTTNITYTVSTGCNAPVSASNTLTVNPSTVITGNPSDATYCQNATATALSVAASGTGTLTYQWFSNTTNSSSGGTLISTSGTYTPSTATAGTFYYYVTVTGGCGDATSSVATITVNPTLDASITSSPTAVCFGDGAGVNVFSTTGGTLTYTTQVVPGGTPVTNTATLVANGSIMLNDKLEANTTVTLVSVTNATGCSYLLGNSSATITVNPLPTVTAINGPALIAIGVTVTYTDATTGGHWSSTYPGIAKVISQNNTISRARVNGVAVGTTTITYTVGPDANGCSNAAELPINVYDNTITRYRTTGSGNFNSTNWEKTVDNGNTWVASSAPDGNNTNIEIRDDVTLDVDYSGSENASFRLTERNGTDAVLKIAPNHVLSSLGGVDFNGKSVIVQSDVTGSGAIGQMANDINNAGNVTVERYTSAGDNTLGRRAWRLVTSPITDKTIRQTWQENGAIISNYGTQITGEGLTQQQATTEGFDYIGGGNHTSIKHYTNPAAYPNGYWQPLPDLNQEGTNIPVRNEQAYLLFVRGDRTVGTATGKGITTLRATGMLNQAPTTVTVDHTKPYTLVGNPYAAPINFDNIYNSSISNTFVVWNSQQGSFGAYNSITRNGANDYTVVPFNASSFNDNTAKYIQSGSGFFVSPTSNATDGSITIDETAKSTIAAGGVGTFREVLQADRKLWVNLNLTNSDTSVTVADGVLSRFNAAYSADIDADDAVKQTNLNENLSILSRINNLMIEARPDVQKTDTIQLRLWNISKRSYQFQVKTDNFSSTVGLHAYLEDNYLKTKQEVSLTGDITTISFSVTSDTLSSKSDRFRIVFQNNAVVLPVTLTSIKATPANGGVNVSWTVTNEVNMKSYTVERSTDGGTTYTTVATQTAKNGTGAIVTNYTDFDAKPKAGDNLYRIRIEAKDGVVTYSSVVSVTIGTNGNIEIAVYPNPVRDGKVSLQLSNLKPGTYLAAVYSEGGQSVYQRKITITQPNTTQSEELKLGKAMAQGSYHLRITDSKGNTIKETKLIVGR